jgi:hypothetical protein
MDLTAIRKNYERLPDDKIIHIANYEAGGLEPAAIEILMEEIRKRELSSNLLEAVKVSSRNLSAAEFEQYIDIIRSLPDPATGDASGKLNAAIISSTISYVFITTQKNKIFIGTDKSIRKQLDSGSTTTAIFGWWGIPFGIIYSLSSLWKNTKARKTDFNGMPTPLLFDFVRDNIGFIEANKNDREALLKHLTASNK